ncbi:hypothetical protein [Olivibacter sitiensis]|uniref:hypothetical protein n=1 Tax=Olivibacter sitiensis TaxID=376470 RepID=UPI000419C8AC|nr:hypothetical protein [Olivibacter sitiensis]
MKDGKILFKERQQFRQWWFWVLLLGFDLFMLWRWYQWGQVSNDFSESGLIVPSVILFLVNVLFFVLQLETVIKEDGIYVRFFPFHIHYKYFPWQDLYKVYVRQYRPLLEYGGWGIRFGAKGRAYNVSGNWGIQLIRKKGLNVLIGTQQPEEVEKVIAGRVLED